jgi:hypothetical protein
MMQDSMSLDGFVADTKDQVGPLFDWYGNALFRAGLIDEVRIDPVPVVFGAGVRYFGDYAESPLPLDDPEILQGDRVTPAVPSAQVMIMCEEGRMAS